MVILLVFIEDIRYNSTYLIEEAKKLLCIDALLSSYGQEEVWINNNNRHKAQTLGERCSEVVKKHEPLNRQHDH